MSSLRCNVFLGGANGGAKLSLPWAQHADLPMSLAQVIRDILGFPSGVAVECGISGAKSALPYLDALKEVSRQRAKSSVRDFTHSLGI